MLSLTATGHQRYAWRQRFHRRITVLTTLLALWSAVLVWRMLQVMVWQREEYVQHLVAASWRVGTLPAMRGRLLDQQGLPLAWSERQFALTYNLPAEGSLLRDDVLALSRTLGIDLAARLPTHLPPAGTTLVLLAPVPVQQVLALQRLGLPRTRIVSTFARRHATLAAPLRRQLGATQVHGQVEFGVSGWELQHDARLRGRDGQYQVMVDKRGEWIPQTWTELAPPRQGYDVYVPIKLGASP